MTNINQETKSYVIDMNTFAVVHVATDSTSIPAMDYIRSTEGDFTIINSEYIIKTNLTLMQMAKIFQVITKEEGLRKFRDKATGAKKVWEALQTVEEVTEETAEEAPVETAEEAPVETAEEVTDPLAHTQFEEEAPVDINAEVGVASSVTSKAKALAKADPIIGANSEKEEEPKKEKAPSKSRINTDESKVTLKVDASTLREGTTNAVMAKIVEDNLGEITISELVESTIAEYDRPNGEAMEPRLVMRRLKRAAKKGIFSITEAK